MKLRTSLKVAAERPAQDYAEIGAIPEWLGNLALLFWSSVRNVIKSLSEVTELFFVQNLADTKELKSMLETDGEKKEPIDQSSKSYPAHGAIRR